MIAGSYRRVEKLFLLLTLVFFAYPIAAILAHPDWSAVARGTFIPTLQGDPDYLILLVGLIGTTITPYMQLFQQSAVVEKGVGRDDYGPERTDAIAGAVFGNVIAAFIIIATAATLHVAGITDIQTAQDAAQALQPVAGDAAVRCLPSGSVGRQLVAGGVLPLATAYSVSEAFGFRKGVGPGFSSRAHISGTVHDSRRCWLGRRPNTERPTHPVAGRCSGAQRDAAADCVGLHPGVGQRPTIDRQLA